MKNKDLDEERSPKTGKDNTLEQPASEKQDVSEATEALTHKDTKEEDVKIVLDGGVITKLKEEPMEENKSASNTLQTTSEKNNASLPSEQAEEAKKKSDEIQKALKNDQQAKIPLKKREMKRSEDFDTSNCGSGGSSIIVRNLAVKEAHIAGEENGLSSENLNGNVSPAVAVEGDGQPGVKLQIKQELQTKDRQAVAEVTETKVQLSETKQEKEHEEKQKMEEAPASKNQTIKEEAMEMVETAVSKDLETSPKLEEAAQRAEKSPECEVIQLRVDSEKPAESVKMEVAEDCSEPVDKEAPVTEPKDQAENEKEPETLKESPCPNEREMDHQRLEIKQESEVKNDPATNEHADTAEDDKTQMCAQAPMETETSASPDSKQQSTTHEQSGPAVQKADKPCTSEEPRSPVDEASSPTLKDRALLEGDKKPESGSTKQTEKQELPKEESNSINNENKESEPLNKENKLREDSDSSKEKERPSLPKENVKTEDCEKSVVGEATNTDSAAKEPHDTETDNSTMPDSEGIDSESVDREKQDAVIKTEERPSPAVLKTEEAVDKDKTEELGSADTQDNKVLLDKMDVAERNVDAESHTEAGGEKGVLSERPVQEVKVSLEDSSEGRKENGEQKSTPEKEVSLGGDTTEGQNRAKEKEKTKTSKADAEDKNVAPEVPQQGIRLKIKVAAHRRRGELQREEGKGDSESEASEGRCLRRSPRICRPTAKLAEIQDRKVEKKQVTPTVEKEKEKEANEAKEGEENAVQKKPREKKVDQEGQAKPKVCVNVCSLVLLRCVIVCFMPLYQNAD